MASPRPPTAPVDAPFREGYTLSACPTCGMVVARLMPGTVCVTPVRGLAHGCQQIHTMAETPPNSARKDRDGHHD